MIAGQRWSRIVAAVEEQGSVSVPELMAALDASESTIRRDLAKLDQMGRLTKVHGGAIRRTHNEGIVVADKSFGKRQHEHTDAKAAIGAFAAKLIGPDDFVYIDGGTTTAALVDAIGPTTATFLTNSLPHAQRLLAKGLRTMLPGGMLKETTEVLVGSEALYQIRRYHFTIGFWGTNGVGLDAGFTTPEFSEAAVKRISIEHTRRRYILADASKFELTSLISFADFSDATVITDHITADELRTAGNVIAVLDEDTEVRDYKRSDYVNESVGGPAGGSGPGTAGT